MNTQRYTPRSTDVQDLRDYLDRERVDHSPWTDSQIEDVIAHVMFTIGDHRWSWKVLAENMLCEGLMFSPDEVDPL